MRVVFLCESLDPSYGGPAFSETSLIQGLLDQHQVDVFCRRDCVNAEFLNSRKIPRPTLYQIRDWFLALVSAEHPLRKAIQKCDLVHLNGHWRPEYFAIALLAQSHAVPYVVHPRGMLWVGHRKVWLKRIYNRLIGFRIVRGASAVIALSRFETIHWAPYQISSQQVVIIPNGIESSQRDKAKTGAVRSSPYFLYLGRLEQRKNLKFLLEAFAIYVRRGGSAQLCLVGPEERGARSSLERLAVDLKLSERVSFHGPAYGAEKREWYARAEAVLYPAMEEPFGRVPFEAIAEGTIPILPDRSGAAEYLGKILHSLVYREGDPEALATCLLEFRRPKFQTELRLAQEWVSTNLSWSRITAQVLETYRRILNPSGVRASRYAR